MNITGRWRAFAGDDGHTWLGHQHLSTLAVLLGAVVGALAFANPAAGGGLGGAVAVVFYTVREARNWHAGNESWKDMAGDLAHAYYGVLIGAAWTQILFLAA